MLLGVAVRRGWYALFWTSSIVFFQFFLQSILLLLIWFSARFSLRGRLPIIHPTVASGGDALRKNCEMSQEKKGEAKLSIFSLGLDDIMRLNRYHGVRKFMESAGFFPVHSPAPTCSHVSHTSSKWAITSAISSSIRRHHFNSSSKNNNLLILNFA